MGGKVLLQITSVRRLVCDSPCYGNFLSLRLLLSKAQVQVCARKTTCFPRGLRSLLLLLAMLPFVTTALCPNAPPSCEQMAFAVAAALLLLACRAAADPASGAIPSNQDASISGAPMPLPACEC